MKRSKYSKIVKLTKNYLEEEKNWGESELLTNPKKRISVNKQELPARAEIKMQYKDLDELHSAIKTCKKCSLGRSRLNAVLGDGNLQARLMFIGEGPGYDEDHQGLPFIGRAGQLLTKIIESIGLKRSDVYIANIVKCHPMIDPSDPEKRGNDRPPTPEEVSACVPYLDAQIDFIKPDFICILGSSASKALLKVETRISDLRGNFCEYRGVKVMPTYHPAALLRSPSLKKDVWEDMKKLRDEMKKIEGRAG